MNPLNVLQLHGQSVWLDYIRRSLITGGELERLVEEDGLRGVTSNPTIFQKAIAGSSDYDDTLRNLIDRNPHMEVRALYERLAVEDIQLAADILRKVYEETDGADGFVSMELSPNLAYDSQGSVEEARRLWNEVNRANMMVKVPATSEGIPVIETLISEGMNVDVTLTFSLSHYNAVAHAYLRGLEKCEDPHRVASVASIFVSRVDTAVDKALEAVNTPEALSLRGKIAIANAKLAYERFKKIFSGESWIQLERKGARVQRLLWASTGTKNPVYSDVLYVEELIGPDTINTMPPETLNAFRDHGKAMPTLQSRLGQAKELLSRLTSLMIDLDKITEKLQADGVNSFAESYNLLLDTLKEKRHTLLHGEREFQTFELGKYKSHVENRLKVWKKQNISRRLWAKDYTLWFPEFKPEITDRLGWLTLPELMHEKLTDFISFAEQVRAEKVSRVVLLGMGGSSLAPEVYQKTFGNTKDYPELVVLDSTHPIAVRSIEDTLDLPHTLFLVSSKSGTTLETISLFRYFWNKVSLVNEAPGNHFVAITDPDTPLMRLAKERSFRKVFQASPDVGGRYSAFTDFGLVPAALIGMDIHRLLDRAWIASENCAFCVSEENSSGLILGASLGELARSRDKLTFLTSSSLERFPDWLEQIIAESTGKDGKGILPVSNEPWISPDDYSKDRFFVSFFLEEDESKELKERMTALEKKGHPVVRINLREKYDLGREIFSWKVAVASAGSILGIHPFNQPDVQLAKDLAKRAMEERDVEDQRIDRREERSLDEPEGIARALEEWLGMGKLGDYVAIQAYLAPLMEATEALQNLRLELLKHTHLATTLGYGPRFLHSTGQLHKGGANNGLFLQLVDEPKIDLAIPETDYSFRTLINAQALGDYQALEQRGRRVLRINLKTDVLDGLNQLTNLIHQ
ncbi:MAG: bifunctional transaldolase/phosoglucose isomerase [Candidatus Aminicenantaceae bacterium]